jgi:hypothetical protein
MTVSLSISFWAGRRYKTFWPKFVFFLIAFVIAIFCSRFKQFWAVIGGVVAMAYFGAWRLQEIIDSRRTK